MLIRIFIRSNIISGAIFKILFRSFYAEILALQGFPAGLRDSYFIRDNPDYPEFRDNQNLSVAGARAGLAGERSGLFMEQIRVVKEMRDADEPRGRTAHAIRPRYMCWENVPYVLKCIRNIMSCKQL